MNASEASRLSAIKFLKHVRSLGKFKPSRTEKKARDYPTTILPRPYYFVNIKVTE